MEDGNLIFLTDEEVKSSDHNDANDLSDLKASTHLEKLPFYYVTIIFYYAIKTNTLFANFRPRGPMEDSSELFYYALP